MFTALFSERFFTMALNLQRITAEYKDGWNGRESISGGFLSMNHTAGQPLQFGEGNGQVILRLGVV